MSKSDAHENDYLKLIYNATGIDNLADNDSTTPNTSIYVALHSADPGEAGSQSTNEVSYSGYARVAVPRSSSGFTVTGNAVTLAAAIDFALSAGGGSNATHFSTGHAASGAGKIIHSGALNNTIACSTAGTTPRLGTGTTITED